MLYCLPVNHCDWWNDAHCTPGGWTGELSLHHTGQWKCSKCGNNHVTWGDEELVFFKQTPRTEELGSPWETWGYVLQFLIFFGEQSIFRKCCASVLVCVVLWARLFWREEPDVKEYAGTVGSVACGSHRKDRSERAGQRSASGWLAVDSRRELTCKTYDGRQSKWTLWVTPFQIDR